MTSPVPLSGNFARVLLRDATTRNGLRNTTVRFAGPPQLSPLRVKNARGLARVWGRYKGNRLGVVADGRALVAVAGLFAAVRLLTVGAG